MQQKDVPLSGRVGRVLATQKPNWYCLEFFRDDGRQEKVNGELLNCPPEGLEVTLFGGYRAHPRYGAQYRIQSLAPKLDIPNLSKLLRHLLPDVTNNVLRTFISSASPKEIVAQLRDDTFAANMLLALDTERANALKTLLGWYYPNNALWDGWDFNDVERNQIREQFPLIEVVLSEYPGALSLLFPAQRDARISGDELGLKTAKALRDIQRQNRKQGDTLFTVDKQVEGALVQLQLVQQFNDGVALNKDAQNEREIFNFIRKTNATYVELSLDVEAVVRTLQEQHRLLITGSPGTGKTTLAVTLAQALNAHGIRSTFLAPTGKAARRLREAVRAHNLPCEPVTVHRFLNQSDHEEPEAVFVDEATMLDTSVFRELCHSLNPHVMFVLVGDHNQLPSISGGQIFADLLKGKQLPTLRLTTNHRQSSGSAIPACAEMLLTGTPLTPSQDVNVLHVEEADVSNQLTSLVQGLLKRYSMRDIQVLSPSYDGAFGVTSLNKTLRQVFNPCAPETFAVGDYVIINENLYELDVVNGDTAYITQVNEQGITLELVDGSHRLFPHRWTRYLDWAWAMSIHKAQGSEFPCVVLMLPTNISEPLNRPEIFYTGATRACASLTLMGDTQINKKVFPYERKTVLQQLMAA